jgi:DNA primase
MKPMIDKEKIQEINRQTDIVALISTYVQLKKVGKNYRALCPFHSEKDPSFYVNPEKGIYYCFGCKKGGNAISFLMEYEHLDFPSAVKQLAKNLGIEIDFSAGLKYRELYEVNEHASQFYALCLTKELGKRGTMYLEERKIDPEVLKQFRLGYAPSSGGLVRYLRQKGVSVDTIAQAGLVSGNREVFRDRLMFPIFNLSGRIIGFGGRSIDDHVKPKYLNSPETPVFKKGDVLYGIHQSKESMRALNEAILVEGYFDLLSLFQAGIRNVCAPLGTSLTEKQAVLISRYAKKSNILFDGDLSGMKAALRAIGLLINAQVDVYVTTLPDNTDPDVFLHTNGVDQLKEILAQAKDFFHFYKSVSSVESVEQEVSLIKDLIQIISTINDPIRFDRYLKYAARVFNISTDALKTAMAGKETVVKNNEQLTPSSEERLLAMIMNADEYMPLVKKVLAPEDFSSGSVRRVFQSLIKDEVYSIDEIKDERLKNRIYGLIVSEEPLTKSAFSEVLVRFKSDVEKKRIQKKLHDALAKGDEEASARYMKQLNTLKKKMLDVNFDEIVSAL